MNMRETRAQRDLRKRGKSMTFDEDMLTWLEDEAARRGWSVSELARTIFAGYREHTAEFERLCPELKVCCPAGAL